MEVGSARIPIAARAVVNQGLIEVAQRVVVLPGIDGVQTVIDLDCGWVLGTH